MGNCLSISRNDTREMVNFTDLDKNNNMKGRYADSLHLHKLHVQKQHLPARISAKGDLSPHSHGNSVRYSNPFTEQQTPPSSCRSSTAGSLMETHVSMRVVSNSLRMSAHDMSLRSSGARMKPSQHPGLRINPESPLTAGLFNLDPLVEDAMLELPPPPALGFRASFLVSNIKASPLSDALASMTEELRLSDANQLPPCKPPSPVLTCVSAVKHMSASTNIAIRRKLANSPLGASISSLDGASISGKMPFHAQDSGTSEGGAFTPQLSHMSSMLSATSLSLAPTQQSASAPVNPVDIFLDMLPTPEHHSKCIPQSVYPSPRSAIPQYTASSLSSPLTFKTSIPAAVPARAGNPDSGFQKQRSDLSSPASRKSGIPSLIAHVPTSVALAIPQAPRSGTDQRLEQEEACGDDNGADMWLLPPSHTTSRSGSPAAVLHDSPPPSPRSRQQAVALLASSPVKSPLPSSPSRTHSSPAKSMLSSSSSPARSALIAAASAWSSPATSPRAAAPASKQGSVTEFSQEIAWLVPPSQHLLKVVALPVRQLSQTSTSPHGSPPGQRPQATSAAPGQRYPAVIVPSLLSQQIHTPAKQQLLKEALEQGAESPQPPTSTRTSSPAQAPSPVLTSNLAQAPIPTQDSRPTRTAIPVQMPGPSKNSVSAQTSSSVPTCSQAQANTVHAGSPTQPLSPEQASTPARHQPSPDHASSSIHVCRPAQADSLVQTINPVQASSHAASHAASPAQDCSAVCLFSTMHASSSALAPNPAHASSPTQAESPEQVETPPQVLSQTSRPRLSPKDQLSPGVAWQVVASSAQPSLCNTTNVKSDPQSTSQTDVVCHAVPAAGQNKAKCSSYHHLYSPATESAVPLQEKQLQQQHATSCSATPQAMCSALTHVSLRSFLLDQECKQDSPSQDSKLVTQSCASNHLFGEGAAVSNMHHSAVTSPGASSVSAQLPNMLHARHLAQQELEEQQQQQHYSSRQPQLQRQLRYTESEQPGTSSDSDNGNSGRSSSDGNEQATESDVSGEGEFRDGEQAETGDVMSMPSSPAHEQQRQQQVHSMLHLADADKASQASSSLKQLAGQHRWTEVDGEQIVACGIA